MGPVQIELGGAEPGVPGYEKPRASYISHTFRPIVYFGNAPSASHCAASSGSLSEKSHASDIWRDSCMAVAAVPASITCV